MDLDQYNRSFEEHVLSFEEEAEARLAAFRQKCIRDFINRLTRQQDEWDAIFNELLEKNKDEIPELRPTVTFVDKPSVCLIDNKQPPIHIQPAEKATDVLASEQQQQQQQQIQLQQQQQQQQQAAAAADAKKELEDKAKSIVTPKSVDGDKLEPPDPFPAGQEEYFTNSLAVKEFTRIQKQQEQNRQLFQELNTSPMMKPFKNELSLYIRSLINSISNSDQHHLNLKSRALINLFLGQPVIFQERQICAAKHPQGQLFAMDLAAQTFVTVGTKLVNSVPAIARSMALVIEGIVKNDFSLFRDLIIGHLQERCPYLIPMYPQKVDFGAGCSPATNTAQPLERYKMACGYTIDFQTKALESEDKWLARMRSMTLIFASVMIQQDDKGHTWSWLASFLSLRPEPVITATILQAYQQETSRTMSQVYRRQYKKLLAFMQTDFVRMIEQVTDRPSGRQPVAKLKNQLSEDYNRAP